MNGLRMILARSAVLITGVIVGWSALAEDETSRLAIQVECELALGQGDQQVKFSDEFLLRSDGPSAVVFSTAFGNPLKNGFLFSLFHKGHSLRSGSMEIIGDVYVLVVTPVFDPNDLYAVGQLQRDPVTNVTTYGFTENAIAAGKVEGQTDAYVDLTVDRQSGAIKTSVYIGSPTRRQRIETDNGKLEFQLAYSVKPEDVPSSSEWLTFTRFPLEKIFSPVSRLFKINEHNKFEIQNKHEFLFKVKLHLSEK